MAEGRKTPARPGHQMCMAILEVSQLWPYDSRAFRWFAEILEPILDNKNTPTPSTMANTAQGILKRIKVLSSWRSENCSTVSVFIVKPFEKVSLQTLNRHPSMFAFEYFTRNWHPPNTNYGSTTRLPTNNDRTRVYSSARTTP